MEMMGWRGRVKHVHRVDIGLIEITVSAEISEKQTHFFFRLASRI